MKLNIIYTFNELYLKNTYSLKLNYCDILNNKYSQIILIESFRNNDGEHKKSFVSKISKPELIVE
jgi:hypothetical protein